MNKILLIVITALVAGNALACKRLTKAESQSIDHALRAIKPKELTYGLDKNLKGCINVFDLLNDYKARTVETGLYRCDFFRMKVIDALPNSTYTLSASKKYSHAVAVSPLKRLHMYASPVTSLCFFAGSNGRLPPKVVVLD